MGKLKYFVSIVVLAGVTISFFFILDYYNKSDFSENKEKIRELELISVRKSYTAEEVLKLYCAGKLTEISFNENADDDKIRQECLNNVKMMFQSVTEEEIISNIENLLLNGEKLEIALSQCVGYIDNEAVLLNIVNIWLEDVLVIYERETGVILRFEYHIKVADRDEGDAYIEKCEDTLTKAAKEYYYGYDLTESEIFSGAYWENINRYVIFAGADTNNNEE